MLTVLYSRKKTKACSKRMNEPILVILWMSFFVLLITKQEMQVTSIQQYTTSSTSSLYCPSKKWIANSVFFLHALFIIIKLDWHARIGTFYNFVHKCNPEMISVGWQGRTVYFWSPQLYYFISSCQENVTWSQTCSRLRMSVHCMWNICASFQILLQFFDLDSIDYPM